MSLSTKDLRSVIWARQDVTHAASVAENKARWWYRRLSCSEWSLWAAEMAARDWLETLVGSITSVESGAGMESHVKILSSAILKERLRGHQSSLRLVCVNHGVLPT